MNFRSIFTYSCRILFCVLGMSAAISDVHSQEPPVAYKQAMRTVSYEKYLGENYTLEFIDYWLDPGPAATENGRIGRPMMSNFLKSKVPFPDDSSPYQASFIHLFSPWAGSNYQPGYIYYDSARVTHSRIWISPGSIRQYPRNYLLAVYSARTSGSAVFYERRAEAVKMIVPMGQRESGPRDIVPGLKNEALPNTSEFENTNIQIGQVKLLSDLDNDGSIGESDALLLFNGTKPGASTGDRNRATEYFFMNDQLSNGIWDVEDQGAISYVSAGGEIENAFPSWGVGYKKQTKPPANYKIDDDAEPLKINIGINFGFAWFEHNQGEGLEFFTSRECKESDKIALSAASPFDLTDPDKTLDGMIYMRAKKNAETPYQRDFELKLKIGESTTKIWTETILPVTLINRLETKMYFAAARDYILENNTVMCMRDHEYTYNGGDPISIWRLCIMREEATSLRGFNALPTASKGVINASGSMPGFPSVVINGNQCYFANGLLEDLRDMWQTARTIADMTQGRLIVGGVTDSISSDNYDTTTEPARGSPLAGPDVIPWLPPDNKLVGPDQVPNTADDIVNPDAGKPGGRFVSYTAGDWEFSPGRATGDEALGGLSSNYDSPLRAATKSQMTGRAPCIEDGKGCVFTATQMTGEGGGELFAYSLSQAGVPKLYSSDPPPDADALELLILDSGDGSLATMHQNPAGNMEFDFIGRKSQYGLPYYVNTYLGFYATRPRE